MVLYPYRDFGANIFSNFLSAICEYRVAVSSSRWEGGGGSKKLQITLGTSVMYIILYTPLKPFLFLLSHHPFPPPPRYSITYSPEEVAALFHLTHTWWVPPSWAFYVFVKSLPIYIILFLLRLSFLHSLSLSLTLSHFISDLVYVYIYIYNTVWMLTYASGGDRSPMGTRSRRRTARAAREAERNGACPPPP